MNTKIKRTKLSAALFALVLALVMSLGGVSSVFADNEIKGTESNQAQIKLAKVLKVSVGTTLPTNGIDFQFEFTPVSFNKATTDEAKNAMPKIGTNNVVTVNIGESDKNKTNNPLVTSSGGIITIPEESDALFGNVAWPDAGYYVYNVKEKTSTYAPTATGFTETLEYSPAVYQVTIGVTAGVSKNYAAWIATKVTTIDNEGQTVDTKIDSTPGGDPQVATDYSGMVFTNRYSKTKVDTDDPDDPRKRDNTALSVSKTVTGSEGEIGRYFPFKVTVTQPTIISGTATYKGYVLESSAVATTASNGAIAGSDAYGSYLTFTSGTEKTIKLKHNQKLVFVGLPVGTSYAVDEEGNLGYQPSVAVSHNGATAIGKSGTVNQSLAITTPVYVGENGDTVDYTNLKDENTSPPTGISLNTIPYIGLIVLAVAALAAYVAVRARRRRSGSY